MQELTGFLNINKPKGKTSHDVVNMVRRALGTKRVGHTGTLDPNATGVLPICVGKATKFADHIMTGEKIYRATVHLGITTDTQDITGEVLERKPVNVTQDQVFTAIKAYIGDIEQIPPMYSAVKIDGKKLYELARAGKTIERKARAVTIHDIYDIVFDSPEVFHMSVHCTSGTYIRTLCQDIGDDLGTGACMGDLDRLRSSDFTLETAVDIANTADLLGALIPLEDMLTSYASVTAKPTATKYLTNGNVLSVNFVDNRHLTDAQTVKLYDTQGFFWGLYQYRERDKKLKPTLFLGA